MSACAGCDVEANGRIGHSRGQIALTGGLPPGKTSAAQTKTSPDSLSFVDSWQIQLTAVQADNEKIGRVSHTRPTVSVVYPHNGAGTNADEVPNKYRLNLTAERSELTQIVANAGTSSQKTKDACVTSGEVSFRRASELSRNANRHRSAEESIKTRKLMSIEGPIPTPLVPAGIPLPSPGAEPLQNSVSLEITGRRASREQSVLNAHPGIRDFLHSNSARSLAEHASESFTSVTDSKTSAAQEASVVEDSQADFSSAVREAKSVRAGNETRGTESGDIKIDHDAQNRAVVANTNGEQSTRSAQIPQARIQIIDSSRSRTTGNLIRAQSPTSRSGNIMQGVAQNSSGVVQTIPQPGNGDSARTQGTLSSVSATELGVPDRRTRSPRTVFGSAMQRQELDKPTSLTATDSSATDSTRTLHSGVLPAAAIAPATNHISTPDRTSIQETMYALDASAGTDSRHAALAHREPMYAEAGYQDPVLGWVGVRAELTRGAVHATVVPQTSEAAQALGGHIAGLHTYLSENHTPVATISLTGFGGSAQHSPRQETGRDAQHGTGDQTGQSNVQELTPDLRSIIRPVTNSVDHESPLPAARSSKYISVMA